MYVDFWTLVFAITIATAAGVIVGAGTVVSVGLRVARYQAGKERGVGAL